MSTDHSYRGRGASVIVRSLLAVGVLWLLFYLIDPNEVLFALERAQILWVLGAFLLLPVHLTLRVFRWNALLRAANIEEDLSYTVKVVIAGYPFSAVTPGELGDVFVRNRFHGTDPGGTIPALVLLDKFLQGVLILLAGIPALAVMLTGSAVVALSCFVLAVAIIAFLLVRRKALLRAGLVMRLAQRFRVEEGLETLATISKGAVLTVLLFAGATLVVFASQEYLLLNAMGDVSYITAWTGYWSVMTVQMVFPFFLAGLGIREGAHVYFFGILGVSAPVALSASLLLFTLNILLPSLAGLAVFLALKRRLPVSQ